MKEYTILVVDDNEENIAVLGGLLQTAYRVRVANSGKKAIALAASSPPPDLILLDVMMPGMDGYAVLAKLRQNPHTADIPVIFVTAMDSDEDEEHGINMGAVDYITKPIRPAIVLARVHAQIELKKARDWLSNQNAYLESEVQRRLRDNQLIQDVSIRALASLAEMRDMETGQHIRRTQAYVELLANRLKDHPRFKHYLSERMISAVVKASPLHDIGKVGIPDHILLKPGRFEPEEFEVMKTHSVIGSHAIDVAMRGELEREEYEAMQAQWVVGSNESKTAAASVEPGPLAFLAVAREIALRHHEKWDGSGYPDGLSGEDIPIPARLMAVADVFDALASKRVYKEAMPVDKAIDIIVEGSGAHFDPAVVEAFLIERDAFVDVLHRFADSDESLAAKRKTVDTVRRLIDSPVGGKQVKTGTGHGN